MNFPNKCKELAQDRANDRIAEVISLAQDYAGEFDAFRNSHSHHKPDCMKNLFAIRNMPYVEVWCECKGVDKGRMIKPYDRYREVPFFQALVGVQPMVKTKADSIHFYRPEYKKAKDVCSLCPESFGSDIWIESGTVSSTGTGEVIMINAGTSRQ